jgi:hypothetical protein
VAALSRGNLELVGSHFIRVGRSLQKGDVRRSADGIPAGLVFSVDIDKKFFTQFHFISRFSKAFRKHR